MKTYSGTIRINNPSFFDWGWMYVLVDQDSNHRIIVIINSVLDAASQYVVPPVLYMPRSWQVDTVFLDAETVHAFKSGQLQAIGGQDVTIPL